MSEMRERLSKLRERVNEDYADAWDFKQIPVIAGKIESFARVDTTRGPKVVCTIVEEDIEPPRRWAVWLSQAALLNRFQQLQPRVGELVAIHYLGQADEPVRAGESPPHRFRVEVDREGSTFEWGSLRSQPEPVYDTNRLSPQQHEVAMERYAPPATDDDIPF